MPSLNIQVPYKQHSTEVRDETEGFVAFSEPFIERNLKRDIQVIRSIVDCPHVFLHAYQNISKGEAQWITKDFFDTDEKDKIIEHWDDTEPVPEDDVNSAKF